MSSAKASKAKFVERLHHVLSYDQPDLRWCGNDKFEVSSNDVRARAALAAEFDFNSLSSFVRQLSYYGFKRLSDRRRSVDKSAGQYALITFSHPSGNFVRDDPGKLSGITRRLRRRKQSAQSSHSGDRRAGSTPGSPPVVKPEEDELEYGEDYAHDAQHFGATQLEAQQQSRSPSTGLYRAGWPGLRLPIQPQPLPTANVWQSPYPTPVRHSPACSPPPFEQGHPSPPYLGNVNATSYFPADYAPTAFAPAPSQMHAGMFDNPRRASTASAYGVPALLHDQPSPSESDFIATPTMLPVHVHAEPKFREPAPYSTFQYPPPPHMPHYQPAPAPDTVYASEPPALTYFTRPMPPLMPTPYTPGSSQMHSQHSQQGIFGNAYSR